MEKFTGIISRKGTFGMNREINYSKFLFMLCLIGISFFCNAQVGITGTTSTTICTRDDGAKIPDFVITESSNGVFGPNGTIVIGITSGFTFNTVAGSVLSNLTGDLTEMPSLSLYNDHIEAHFDKWVPANNSNDGSYQYSYPLGSNLYYQKSAMLYTASEMGFTGNRNLTGISFFLDYASSPVNTPVVVYLRNTSASNLLNPSSASYPAEKSVTGTTMVFNSTIPASSFVAGQWVDINFFTPFLYLNNSNLEVIVETNFGTYNPSNLQFRCQSVPSKMLTWYNYSLGYENNLDFSSYSLRPNIAFHYPIGSTNTDAITFSGIRVKATTPSISGQMLGSASSNITGISSYNFGNISSLQSVQLLGMKDSYCQNEGLDTLSYFPSGGSFSYSPSSIAGVLNTISASKVSFDPGKFDQNNTTPASVIYSVPGFSGCSSITKDISVKKLPLKSNISFSVPLATSYAHGNNPSGVTLAGSGLNTDAFGYGYFTGDVVLGTTIAGFSFFPDVITRSLPDYDTVTFHYINYSTGCSNSVKRGFTTYDPSQVLFFTPTPILGQGKFCINDYTTYKIALSPSLVSPETYYSSSLFGTNFCPLSASITAGIGLNSLTGPGVNGWGYGITTTGVTIAGSGIHQINSFKFNPSLISTSGFNITGAGLSFDMDYNFDFLASSLTGCSGPRVVPRYWGDSLKTGTRQPIIVYAQPQTPQLAFGNKSYCQGAVVDTALNISNYTGTESYEWYLFSGGIETKIIGPTTSPGILLSNLGLSTVVGVSTYHVKNLINGCKSDIATFDVTIKAIPSVPGVNNLTLPSFCFGARYNSVQLNPDYTVSGTNVIYNWFKNTPPSSGSTVADLSQAVIKEDLTTDADYYLTVKVNGCSSNEIISSTVPGPGATIAHVPIVFNLLPNPPTITGSNIFCQNGNISLITVVGYTVAGANGSPIDFKWYTDNAGTVPAIDSLGAPFGMPGGIYINKFNSNLNSSTISNVNFYVNTRYTNTGCKSASPLQVNVIVNEVILPPTVISLSGSNILNDGKPFCYNYGAGNLIGISITGNSLYTSPVYALYTDTTATFLQTTTGIGFNTTITDNNIGHHAEYYVKQFANSCASAFLNVAIDVNPPVLPPTIAQPNFYCTGQTIQDLIAVTTIPSNINPIKWYTSTVTSIVSTVTTSNFNPVSQVNLNNNIPSSNLYYANATDANGCVSTLTSVNIDIRQTPVAPVIFDVSSCSGSYTSIAPVNAETSLLGVSQYFEWSYGSLTATGIPSTVAGTIFQEALDVNMLSISNFISNTSRTDIKIGIRQFAGGCPSIINQTGAIRVFSNPASAPTINPATKNDNCEGDILPTIQVVQGGEINPIYTWTVPGIRSLSFNTPTVLGTNPTSINSSDYIVNTLSGWISASSPPKKSIFYVDQTINRGIYGNSTFPGCTSAYITDTVNIFAIPPPPSYINIPSYCAGDIIAPVTLVGVSTVSVDFRWFSTSTLGVSLSSQNPFVTNTPNTALGTASISKYYATQRYNRCTSTSTIVGITVYPLPIVDINIPRLDYCNNESVVTVSGNPLGGNFITTVIGFTSLGGGNAQLSPTTSGENLQIEYTYQEPVHSCINFAIKTINIYSKPVIKLDFPTTSPGFCAITNTGVQLFPSNTNNGTLLYSVVSLSDNAVLNAVTSGVFNPYRALRDGLDADSVNIQLIYNVLNTPCSDTIVKKKYVYVQPVASYVIPGKCEGDTLTFSPNVFISGGNINNLKYTWKFGVSDTSSGIGPAYRSAKRVFKVGSVSSSLKVETSFGCSSLISQQFQVGPYPKPNFDWKFICQGASTMFHDTTFLSSGFIIGRKWDFGNLSTNADTVLYFNKDGNIPNTMNYVYPDTGSYNVHFVVTSDKACQSDTTLQVNILPKKSITPAIPYFNNFNTTKDGWFAEGKNNSWVINDASKTLSNNPVGIGKVWYIKSVGDSVYTLGQSSSVNSPCFDISSLQKPMASLRVKADVRDGIDGALLQYSVDDGSEWINVGSLNSGIDWYNNDNILASPGNTGATGYSPSGWSGSDLKDWVYSKNIIDLSDSRLASNKGNVRFRIAFASASSSTELSQYEGIAFDDIWIGERSKMALIEHFLNENNDESAIATVGSKSIIGNETTIRLGVDDIIDNNSSNITSIKYHTSFPANDIFNEADIADPGARVLFYGVQNAPTTILDGNAYNASINSLTLEDSLRKMSELETLDIPDFLISINKSISDNTLKVDINYSANQPFAADTLLVLQVAVVERTINSIVGKNGQNRFESVLRSFLPDAAGTVIQKDWQIGNTGSNSFSWNIANIIDNDQIAVVAFIQNVRTKKVLQAAYNGPLVVSVAGTGYGSAVVTEVSNAKVSDKSIQIYPNPARDHITIRGSEELIFNSQYKLFDQYGKTVTEGICNNHVGAYSIGLGEIASGVYLLQIVTADRVINRTKIIVIK